MQKFWDVIILGAGAAGLFCAITAANRGHRVLVLEKSNKVGKKILMSGGGRCNFTNLHTEADNFLSQNPHFCKSALSRYTQWEFIELVNRHGIKFHEKTLGQLFCDHSSKDILNLLLKECEAAKVEIQAHVEIETVAREQKFVLTGKQLEKEVSLTCDKLVVATGGLSIPSLGGSDFGYRLARKFGHQVLPQRAGLVPFIFTDSFKSLSETLSGISVAASVNSNNQNFDENILFSHRGLSGPAILQVSNYWQEGDYISINLLPDLNAYEHLLEQKTLSAKNTITQFAIPTFAKKTCARTRDYLVA